MAKDGCLSFSELIAHLDGDVPPNRAGRLRAHISACSTCQRELVSAKNLIDGIAAPVANLQTEGATERVLAGLDAELDRSSSRRAVPRAWLLATGGCALAGIALVLYLHAPGRRSSVDEDFAPRGRTASSSLGRRVGVTLQRVKGKRLERLLPGEEIADGTGFAVSYRNLVTDRSIYILVFGIDAHDDLHWIYPAFTDATTDPMAVKLEVRAQETVFSEGVALEHPAAGPMRIVTMILDQPLYVSRVEQLPAERRTVASLRKEWPMATIDEVSIRVRSTERSASP